MIDYKEFQHLLNGQWEEVLKTYGIEIPKMRGKNSTNYPCPCCGGDDRAHWRESDGRLALFCRSCAADSMKSPEQVIQEVCSIGFNELVHNLADFVNHRTPEDIKKAQVAVSAKPKRNMPVGHKQDHEKSMAFVDGCDDVHRHYIFDRFSVQPPGTVKAKENAVFFPMYNEGGAMVNVFAIIDKPSESKQVTQFLAGGVSYGAWHVVDKCEVRESKGIAWSDSIIKAYNHWYKTGQEVRVTFCELNTVWMQNVGIICDADLIIE